MKLSAHSINKSLGKGKKIKVKEEEEEEVNQSSSTSEPNGVGNGFDRHNGSRDGNKRKDHEKQNVVAVTRTINKRLKTQVNPNSAIQSNFTSLWDNLNSLQEFKDFLDKNCDSEDRTVSLIYTIAVVVKSLIKPMNGALHLNDDEVKEKMIEIAAVTHDGIEKYFYYQIRDGDCRYYTLKQMKIKLKEFIDRHGMIYYCKGFNECKLKKGQSKCQVQGRSDYVLAHLQKIKGFKNVCFYCLKFTNFRIQHLKEHFINYHWKQGFRKG